MVFPRKGPSAASTSTAPRCQVNIPGCSTAVKAVASCTNTESIPYESLRDVHAGAKAGH